MWRNHIQPQHPSISCSAAWSHGAEHNHTVWLCSTSKLTPQLFGGVGVRTAAWSLHPLHSQILEAVSDKPRSTTARVGILEGRVWSQTWQIWLLTGVDSGTWCLHLGHLKTRVSSRMSCYPWAKPHTVRCYPAQLTNMCSSQIWLLFLGNKQAFQQNMNFQEALLQKKLTNQTQYPLCFVLCLVNKWLICKNQNIFLTFLFLVNMTYTSTLFCLCCLWSRSCKIW